MYHFDPELEVAFKEIQWQAECFDDLKHWFVAHIEVLTGGLSLPANANIDVDLTYFDTSCRAVVAATGALKVGVFIEATAPYKPHPLLEEQHGVSTPGSDALVYKKDFNLLLPLKDWPLATALTAGLYFVRPFDTYARRYEAQYTDRLERALALHFAGHTLSSIRDILSSGIVPLNDQGHPSVESIAEILFLSRPKNMPLAPPRDLA